MERAAPRSLKPSGTLCHLLRRSTAVTDSRSRPRYLCYHPMMSKCAGHRKDCSGRGSVTGSVHPPSARLWAGSDLRLLVMDIDLLSTSAAPLMASFLNAEERGRSSAPSCCGADAWTHPPPVSSAMSSWRQPPWRCRCSVSGVLGHPCTSAGASVFSRPWQPTCC